MNMDDNNFDSSFASSNLSEKKKRSLSKPLRKSATTSGGVLAGRTIAGAVGNKWGFSVSSRARTVWAAKPRVPQPDTGKPICSTAERVRGSFLFLLSVHTERRKYLNVNLIFNLRKLKFIFSFPHPIFAAKRQIGERWKNRILYSPRSGKWLKAEDNTKKNSVPHACGTACNQYADGF